ncbi:n-alpha-acetyltransferase 40 [Nannochloropsis oceanica]
MSMKGKGGKGGKAKGGGKSTAGGQTIEIKRSKDRLTASINESILTLRQALFDDLGQNKDVSVGIAAPFLKYDRKGLDVTIEFKSKLSKEEMTWAFDAVKETMEETYDNSGYGWDDEDKLAQLTEPEARFLVIREALFTEEKDENTAQQEHEGENKGKVLENEKETPSHSTGKKKTYSGRDKKGKKKGALVGIVHFRFSVQGDFVDKMAGAPSLILWDIAILADARRKGLGKHCLLLLELIARKQAMHAICVPVQLSDQATLAWVTKGGKGYVAMEDEVKESLDFEAEEEGFEVYIKTLLAPPPLAAVAPTLAPAVPVVAKNEGEEKGKKEQMEKDN